MEESKQKCEMIWKIWQKGKSNSDKIWKIWKKGKLNSEKIWKIWKKAKLYSEMIWKIWNISVLVIITPKKLPLLLPSYYYSSSRSSSISHTHFPQSSSSSHIVEIPPKACYKQKQNETHYENITHWRKNLWKLRKKSKLNSEKIWKIQKKIVKRYEIMKER